MLLNRKKILKYVIPLLLIAITALLLNANLKQIDESPVMVISPWALQTVIVQTGLENKGFPALGKVVSSSEVRIVPQISGTVLKMGPREGGLVKKGDLLVHLDTRELEAVAESTQAKLASAIAIEGNNQKELLREEELFGEGGASATSVEQYQTRVRSGQANVRSLKKQLESLQIKISYGHIRAPINGRIAQRLAEPGDAVFPGKSVYSLTADQGGRVVVRVPLDTVTRIRIGGKVMLKLGEQQMMARITRINPSLDALSMGSLEIDLSERPFSLPSGASIAARVITEEAGPGLRVSVDALRPSEQKGERMLFKVVPEKQPYIQLTPIHVQLCGRYSCIVEGDLLAGDRIVVAHGSVLLRLHDGDKIMDDWSSIAEEHL